MRRISPTVIKCTFVFALLSLSFFHESANAQHKKVPKDPPLQVVDTSTGKTIPEILILPLYSHYAGVFIAPEGPAYAKSHFYLDHPFIYRAGEPFKIKQPREFTGLPLLMVFIGEGRDLDGIVVVAPGYRPLWTVDLWWYPPYERKLKLTPVKNDDEWSQILETDLKPFLNGASHVREGCELWNLKGKCNLKVKYDKKERRLVSSFLQPTAKVDKLQEPEPSEVVYSRPCAVADGQDRCATKCRR